LLAVILGVVDRRFKREGERKEVQEGKRPGGSRG